MLATPGTSTKGHHRVRAPGHLCNNRAQTPGTTLVRSHRPTKREALFIRFAITGAHQNRREEFPSDVIWLRGPIFTAIARHQLPEWPSRVVWEGVPAVARTSELPTRILDSADRRAHMDSTGRFSSQVVSTARLIASAPDAAICAPRSAVTQPRLGGAPGLGLHVHQRVCDQVGSAGQSKELLEPASGNSTLTAAVDAFGAVMSVGPRRAL